VTRQSIAISGPVEKSGNIVEIQRLSFNGSMINGLTASCSRQRSARRELHVTGLGATVIKPRTRGAGWSVEWGGGSCSAPKAIRVSDPIDGPEIEGDTSGKMLPARTHGSVTPTRGLERAKVFNNGSTAARDSGPGLAARGNHDSPVHMESCGRSNG